MIDTKDIIFSLVLFITVCVIWYFGWIKPHDAYLASMMDCMEQNGDRTEQGYRECELELRYENR